LNFKAAEAENRKIKRKTQRKTCKKGRNRNPYLSDPTVYLFGFCLYTGFIDQENISGEKAEPESEDRNVPSGDRRTLFQGKRRLYP